MSTLPWKKIALVLVAIGTVLAGVFYFNKSTADKPVEAFINPAFGEHISGFTAGVISSGSNIRIELSNDAIDSTSVGSESSVRLFEFTPGIAGKAVWLDRRTVEFQPLEKLQSGQMYTVNFFLSKILTDLPDGLETFQYAFQVIPQNFEVSIENIVPYVKTELTRQKIQGQLFTADVADDIQVEKILTASQDGKPLKVLWTHTGDNRQHQFIVEDVARKETGSKVNLQLSGESLGIDRSEQKEVEIPSLGDFKMMTTRVVQNPNQYVVLQFSDPLKEGQDLAGLISISDVPDLDFDIRENEIWVYPPVRQTGTKTVTIEGGISNILNYKMKEGTSADVVFEQLNPAVRFTGKGNILPGTDGMVLPFEAVNLKSVDVQIIRIYERNVLQFLQVNTMDSRQEIRRVGKPIFKKTVSLENTGVADLGKWNRFTLDLKSMIQPEPGAIYQVQVGFKKYHTALECGGEEQAQPNPLLENAAWDEPETEGSYWDSYEDYYYDSDYDWEQRDNPCHSSYYNGSRSIQKNVLSSDLGIIAKRGGDENTLIFVNDLRSTKPLSNVILELYDYQQQVIGTATTDANGKAIIAARQKPFAVVAKNGSQRGYLKVLDGESLSLSNFDISGEQVNRGLKGFLYGERGVWRPGDSLYLTFILEDKLKTLPENHPVVFELSNPQGMITNRLVRSNDENGFYSFATATESDAPTGNWSARVKVGGAEFNQNLKIEMVKPNRLKINLDFGKEKLTAEDNNVSGDLLVKWLHGAPGRNLKAEFEVLLTKAETKFSRFPDFVFEDPSRDFSSEAKVIFQGSTDEEGHARVSTTLDASATPPGMLNAVFRGKVFEEGGDFSIDKFSLPFYPYESFTGIRVPEGDKARGMLLTDTTHQIDVVTIDPDGKAVSRKEIKMALYKLNWRWWWDNSGEDPSYMSDSYATLISEGTISTQNGKGKWGMKVKYPDWGRFLVKATDPVSGHSTAKVIYIDWPGWAGRSRGGNEGATMLAFSSDKPGYTIGERASIVIPGSGEGRALVSIENGSQVIQTDWVETKKGDTPYTFEVKPEMAPNVFVHVTLLQPHAQTINDLPIRLYGVIPVKVEDPKTHLEPVIQMPDVLEPGKEVVIKVSEKTNRKMSYTVAMVDEGLLDLTRFKTPDAWKRFYAREALGVKSWDMYDQVIGAFGGDLERLLTIGGDGEGGGKEQDSKANRFKPVVKFFGPFTLDGSSDEHRFIMPQYIGSVKTMLVAGYEGAYGSAEKVTPVRKPLMVLATLPRVLGPEETLKLPVTIFTMDPAIRTVKVEVKTSGPVDLKENVRTVTMSGSDMTVVFDMSVKSLLGQAKVEVTVSSGNFRASDLIDITIRNPNPPVSKTVETMVEAGKTWSTIMVPVGMQGTNSALLEVSNLPPINLGRRLKYLIQYPYGCVEQTTSSVFPQLFVDQVKQVTEEERSMMQRNVRAGINRLKSFQQPDGGFAYWPGHEDADSWSSTYVGHFLIEAEAKGYMVPNDMMKKWKKFQRNRANAWRKNFEPHHGDLIQAYRLYVMALAGDPDMGNMNRLRELDNLSLTSSWMLASAYAQAGQPEAARALIAKLPTELKPYQEMAYTYGSDLRDKAIMLETLILLKERERGFKLLKEISQALSNENYWMSTQTTAWCLKSAGAFASNEKRGPLEFSYTYNGKQTQARTDLPVAQVTLDPDNVKNMAVQLVNTSKSPLFVRLIMEGTPARGQEVEESQNLSMNVVYTDLDGVTIDPSKVEQGTTFIASVSVMNSGVRGDYKNLALNQIFPSGWEINNLRLDEAQARLNSDVPTYQDIRDDRVYTYFDLPSGKRKNFKVMLTAGYAGTWYLPAVSCEAMYDRSVYSRIKGQVVDVVQQPTQ
jgi:alpha-2-macroglobulin